MASSGGRPRCCSGLGSSGVPVFPAFGRQSPSTQPQSLGPRLRAWPNFSCLQRSDGQFQRAWRIEPPEGRVELVIVAGDLVARGNVRQRIAPVEDAEISVRPFAVVHELAVV